MTRGQAWRFLDMGRKIERAQHTVGLLQSTLTPSVKAEESTLLEALLEIADSSMTYRTRSGRQFIVIAATGSKLGTVACAGMDGVPRTRSRP